MLTRLRVRNFKAWRDSGDIRLAPLTVFFGSNSAGKSSLPQLLLLLKQTAESPDRQRALHLGDSRALVDVGTYDEAVHLRDIARPLEFSLDWALDAPLDIVDPVSERAFSGDALAFSASLGADERHQPRVNALTYRLTRGDDRETVLDLSMLRAAADAEAPRPPGVSSKAARKEPRTASAPPSFDLSSERYELSRFEGRTSPLSAPVRFYGFPRELGAYFRNAAFAADLVFELEQLFGRLYHVGPLREYPKRLYVWSGNVPEHVGERGERAIDALLAAGDRTFSWRPKQKGKSLPALVAERLHEMRLIDDFQVKALGRHRKEFEVLVRTSPKLPEVALPDVGFGVSQVLPVIVECFFVPRRSIVIFEQPEIHLHPRVQAELADLFIDAIRAREDGAPRDCQFIIESHSEHFLRRLQRRIAEEALSKEETALYFVDTEHEGARLNELELDEFGNILNWPDDFFGDEMTDLVARSAAQATRTKRSRER